MKLIVPHPYLLHKEEKELVDFSFASAKVTRGEVLKIAAATIGKNWMGKFCVGGGCISVNVG